MIDSSKPGFLLDMLLNAYPDSLKRQRWNPISEVRVINASQSIPLRPYKEYLSNPTILKESNEKNEQVSTREPVA